MSITKSVYTLLLLPHIVKVHTYFSLLYLPVEVGCLPYFHVEVVGALGKEVFTQVRVQ